MEMWQKRLVEQYGDGVASKNGEKVRRKSRVGPGGKSCWRGPKLKFHPYRRNFNSLRLGG